MKYRDYLQLIYEWLVSQRQVSNPDENAGNGMVFTDLKTGETVENLDELAARMEAGANVCLGFKGEKQPYFIADRKLFNERLATIKEFTETVPSFKPTEEDIKKMVFTPALDILHDEGAGLEAVRRKVDEISERYPLPQNAVGINIFSRCASLYTDISETEEGHRNNLRLKEELATDAGKRKFAQKVVRDFMSADISELFKARNYEDSLKFYYENRKNYALLFISNHVVADTRYEPIVIGEPLRSELEKRRVIAQSAENYCAIKQIAERDDYYLLPYINLEICEDMIDRSPKVTRCATAYANYFGKQQAAENESKQISRLADMGALEPGAEITDESGNTLTLNDALNELNRNRQINVVPASEEKLRELQEQLDNLFEIDEEVILRADRLADEKLPAEMDRTSREHAEMLDKMGPLGKVRKELEFQQYKFGQTTHEDEDKSYRKELTARILALGNIAQRLSQAQEKLKTGTYGQEDFDELAAVLTDPEQIDENTQQILNSGSFDYFYGNVSPDDLDSFAIKDGAHGGLTADNFDEVTATAEMFEQMFRQDEDKAYKKAEEKKAADALAEAEEAKKWYRSLGEEMKKRGLDTDNRYSMGLVMILADPGRDYSDIESEDMEMQELYDLAMNAKHVASYAAVPHDNQGKYIEPMPETDGRKQWLDRNLKKYNELAETDIVNMYRMAKQGKLVIASTGTQLEYVNPPSIICAGNDGRALITPPFGDFIDKDSNPIYTKYAEYGISADIADKIIKRMKSYLFLSQEIDVLGDYVKDKGGNREMRKDIYKKSYAEAGPLNAIKAGVNHPEWLEGEKGEKIWKDFVYRSIPYDYLSDEEKLELRSFVMPDSHMLETERKILKLTGMKSIDEVINAGIVKKLDGTDYDKDSLSFLDKVDLDSRGNAVLIETTDKKTGEKKFRTYTSQIDLDLCQAYNSEIYYQRLNEATVVSDGDSEEIKNMKRLVDDLRENTIQLKKKHFNFGRIKNIEDKTTEFLKNADVYTEALSKEAHLTSAQIQNLKTIGQISLIHKSAAEKDAYCGSPLEAIALKTALVYAEHLLSAGGTITLPAQGNKPAQNANAREFGMRMLTDRKAQADVVKNMLKDKRFTDIYAGKTTAELLKELRKPDDILFDDLKKHSAPDNGGHAQEHQPDIPVL